MSQTRLALKMASDVAVGGVTGHAQSALRSWTGDFFQPVSSGNTSRLGMDPMEFFADDRFDRQRFYCADEGN